MKMSREQYRNIERWMYRNARPVDLARWQYHLEDSSNGGVLRALGRYQNEDGGFAHALEADSWNPSSSPIETWCATELMREVGMDDADSPLIRGVIDYLSSGSGFSDGKWMSEIASNNEYPHAPWWEWSASSEYGYNPTACLAGFALKYAAPRSPLYGTAAEIAMRAAGEFMSSGRIESGHELLCFVRLHQYCAERGVRDLFDMDAYADRLAEHTETHLREASRDWSVDGVIFELIYARASFPGAAGSDAELMDGLAEHIIGSLNPDGTWEVPWSWSEYGEEWAVSKNWWRAYGVIANMRFLRRGGYIERV